jgi:hypothetical protein
MRQRTMVAVILTMGAVGLYAAPQLRDFIRTSRDGQVPATIPVARDTARVQDAIQGAAAVQAPALPDATPKPSPEPPVQPPPVERPPKVPQPPVAPPSVTPPPIQPPPTTGAWFVEDFSGYATTADLLKYPNPMWSGANEDVNVGRIQLDTDAPPVGGKSMRYDFPNRTNDTRRCNDYTIGRNIKFPQQVPEFWGEVWVKMTVGFTTKVAACRSISNAQYKMLFVRVQPSRGRFDIMVGTYGNQTVLGLPDDSEAFTGPPDLGSFADGQWHRWQFHAKLGASGGWTVALDGNVVRAIHQTVKRKGLSGISLGRNMNQGPMQPQSIWWGGIQVYRVDPGWRF